MINGLLGYSYMIEESKIERDGIGGDSSGNRGSIRSICTKGMTWVLFSHVYFNTTMRG